MNHQKTLRGVPLPLFFLLFLLIPPFLPAQDLPAQEKQTAEMPRLGTIGLSSALYWQGNEAFAMADAASDNRNMHVDSDRGQIIATQYGLSLRMDFPRQTVFALAPELLFSLLPYTWNAQDTKARPSAPETRDHVRVLTLHIDPAFQFLWPINKDGSMRAGFSASPAVALPIIVGSVGSTDEIVGPVLRYLYGNGRFFYPKVSAVFDWAYSKTLLFQVKLNAFLPIFHLWDGEVFSDGINSPIYDRMVISLSLAYQYRLAYQQGKKEAADQN